MSQDVILPSSGRGIDVLIDHEHINRKAPRTGAASDVV